MLTEIEKTAKLKALADIDLGNLTANELKFHAKGLITGYTNLKKQDLIDKLKIEIKVYMDDVNAKASDFVKEFGEGEDDVNATFIKNALGSNQSLEMIASVIVNKWQNTQGKIEGQTISKATLVKSKPKQLRAILETIYSEENSVITVDSCNQLYDEVRKQLQTISAEVNKEYGQKVEENDSIDNQLNLEGQKIIDWCNETLKDFINGDKKVTWHKVSLALALTSGRRMDEIHGDISSYEIGFPETYLRSIGLSKKPEDDMAVLNAPCLVDVDLWLEAFAKLPEDRKGLTNAKVNGVISSAISDTLKRGTYTYLGLTKYKDARDFYIAYLIDTFYQKSLHGSEIRFIKQFLGHDSKKVSLSYQKVQII